MAENPPGDDDVRYRHRRMLLLQSSSPSYLLMASLEAAALHATENGTFEEAVQAAQVGDSSVQICSFYQLPCV